MVGGRFQVVATALLIAASMVVAVPPVEAANRTVRLEPGIQTGYRFTSAGAISARKTITIATTPALTSTDRRRLVPGRSGIWLRVASGALAGYEVLESPIAYIPGIAGDTRTSPPVKITFGPGSYLGYRFDASWGLASTRSGSVATSTSATSGRRAVIDGRPYVLLASGPWTGTWMPVTVTRGRTAQRLTCSVPAKPAAGVAAVLRRVTTKEPKVALTFDLGGRLTPALDILERLVIDRVCATIHPTGDTAKTTTGTAVLAFIRAHPDLFEVGNHTMHHCNLRDGGTGSSCPVGPATAAQIQTELTTAATIIRDRSGRDPLPYWRPPYGASDARVRAAAAAIGYTKTLLWDVDTIDWRKIADGGPTATAMATKVVSNVGPGSIVLMHLGGYHTYDALPSMVLRLRAAGLQPSTVSDLLVPG